MVIGVIGGAGRQGSALARRYCSLGEDEVIVGSRTPQDARGKFLDRRITLTSNEEACRAGLVVLAIPWDVTLNVLTPLVGRLRGKTVVSMINPLSFDAQGAHPLRVSAGSAAQAVQELLADSNVAIAFNLVSASLMGDVAEPLLADVPVCARDIETSGRVRAWVQRSGARALDSGPLSCAVAVESMAAVVMHVSAQYAKPVSLRLESAP